MTEQATTERSAGRSRPRPDRFGSIPERLNYLFAAVHVPGRRPYSAAEVARWINDNGGSISAVYILKILSGERQEPSWQYLTSLAAFFEVDPEFFTSDEPPAVDGETADARIRMRSDQAQRLLQKATLLSPRSLDALDAIIDSLLRAEGRDGPGFVPASVGPAHRTD